MGFFQLRLKEGYWIRRTEKPGRYRLYEHRAAVSLLHQLLPKGIGSISLPGSTFSEQLLRLFIKSRQRISNQQRAPHLHFSACSTTYRPPINPFVRTAPNLDELDHRTDRSPSHQVQLS